MPPRRLSHLGMAGAAGHPHDPVLASLYHASLAAYRELDNASGGALALDPEPVGLLHVGRDLRAVQAISDNRGYNYIAGFHGAPGNYCCHHQVNPRTPLQVATFLES